MSACGMAANKIFMVGGWENDTGSQCDSKTYVINFIQNLLTSLHLTTTRTTSGARKAKWALREVQQMPPPSDFQGSTGQTNFLKINLDDF
jgi:hypothetical protein